MSLLQPELSSPHRPSTGSKIAGPLLAAGAALVLVGAGLALGTQRAPAIDHAQDPCGLPAGIRLGDLDAHDSALVTRRLLACSDLRFDRITHDQYRTAVAAIDKQWNREEPAVARPQIVWASSVRGFSSQYSTGSWSAAQVLGAPNVYPAHGDNASAWASLGADDRDEWIEVGFDRAGSVSAVEIYETYNAGALDRVELITQSGRIIAAQPGGLAPSGATSARRSVNVSCTSEPIVAVRVHVASMKVAGWNELDAIGVVPCTK